MTHCIRRTLALMLLGFFAACGGGEEPSTNQAATPGSSRPSGRGVCGLLMQAEVDELFGTSVGAGVDEALSDGSEICSWPAGQDPSLLLQVGAVASDIVGAVDLGEGYLVAEVSGMNGPAAVATQLSDSEKTVAILAMNAGEKSIILSPIGLGLQEASAQFERLKELMGLMAQRM